jgi:hypothetical protein
MIFNRTKKPPRIYFNLIIDYNEQQKNAGYTLGDLDIIFPNNSKYEFPISQLIDELNEYLERYLPEEIYESFGYQVKVKIRGTRKGSIVVIFSIILATYYGISKYKNFIESSQLIGKHVKWLVQSFLDSRFGRLLIANVETHPVAPEIKHVFNFNNSIISTLIGVLLGALIAGFFSLKTQQIENEQQMELFGKQQTIAERSELKSALSEYTNVIVSYMQLIDDPNIDSIKIREFDKRSFNVAFKLSLFTNIDLGSKSFEINTLAIELLKKKLTNSIETDELEVFTDKISDWVISAKVELKYLEYSANPDNLEKDLLRLLINSSKIGSSESEKAGNK